jgi:phenylacetate-coenzyme A ligase PaaK-like adenylate-forming protein
MFLAQMMESLTSWENSVKDPKQAQAEVLRSLLAEYQKTGYGEKRQASAIGSIDEYRRHFPTVTYDDIKVHLREVQRGNYGAFLSEQPVAWVMTRGSTGEPKILPATQRHLQEIFGCGSRAVLNYAVRNRSTFMLQGRVLNLNFPSNTREFEMSDRKVTLGHSSGTYARLNPTFEGLVLIPRQEKIDALRTGLSKTDWDRRFELIYMEAKDENVVCIIGVAPVQASFARYVKRRHGVYPRDIWKMKVIFTTSVAKIQSKYTEILQALYGEAPLVEMYTATEGAFAQQKDEFPYVVPNYDTYLFEAQTRRGVKMLHEMERGEWGRLIVSTSMLPRYDIGDLIEAMGRNYYRVFGRANPRTVIEHNLYRALFRWFL